MTSRPGRIEITIRTEGREVILDITDSINDALPSLTLSDGAVLLFCPHTTAALTANEVADPAVRADISSALAEIVPDIAFRHTEGNSAAHLKAALVGPSLLVPVAAGKLVLGTWQGVYFCEFDGPRWRRVWAFSLGSAPL